MDKLYYWPERGFASALPTSVPEVWIDAHHLMRVLLVQRVAHHEVWIPFRGRVSKLTVLPLSLRVFATCIHVLERLRKVVIRMLHSLRMDRMRAEDILRSGRRRR